MALWRLPRPDFHRLVDTDFQDTPLTLRPVRSRSRQATLYTESSDSFVASAAASIATGWSEPVPGRELHPLESSAFHGALLRQLTFASGCNVTPCNTIPDMPSEWNLHYARWVIQDGEPDRDVGESFEWFAVEFWSESGLVTAKDVNERSAVPVADFKYLVTAQVAFVSEKASVI